MTSPLLPPKPFLMIRHGESTANADGSVAGIVDVALTDRGRAQAAQARACFDALPALWRPRQIVHSHLSRAKETALIINAQAQLPLYEDAALGERCFGQWAYRRWSVYAPRLEAGETPPDGESIDAFADRALGGLTRQLNRFDSLTLFSCHGGIFSALAYRYGCAQSELADVDNCTLYSFTPAPEKPVPWQVARLTLGGDGRLAVTPLTLAI